MFTYTNSTMAELKKRKLDVDEKEALPTPVEVYIVTCWTGKRNKAFCVPSGDMPKALLDDLNTFRNADALRSEDECCFITDDALPFLRTFKHPCETPLRQGEIRDFGDEAAAAAVLGDGPQVSAHGKEVYQV